MDINKKNLIGSPARDLFKRYHKELNKKFYASDADLCLIDKFPPGVVAYLDFKKNNDSVTFAEVILYNEWIKTRPVYIVQGDDIKSGVFSVYKYLGGDYKPFPPKVQKTFVCNTKNWQEYEAWEQGIRSEYRRIR